MVWITWMKTAESRIGMDGADYTDFFDEARHRRVKQQ
jgi:hypothetical protein